MFEFRCTISLFEPQEATFSGLARLFHFSFALMWSITFYLERDILAPTAHAPLPELLSMLGHFRSLVRQRRLLSAPRSCACALPTRHFHGVVCKSKYPCLPLEGPFCCAVLGLQGTEESHLQALLRHEPTIFQTALPMIMASHCFTKETGIAVYHIITC